MRTGTVNVSILRGGVMEHPGDVICEDGDGMIVCAAICSKADIAQTSQNVRFMTQSGHVAFEKLRPNLTDRKATSLA
jgi:regulator of RNase E activity RraA